MFSFIGFFVKAEGMVEMLPPWIPFRLTLVYLTGLHELLVGLALFLPKHQVYSAKIAIMAYYLCAKNHNRVARGVNSPDSHITQACGSALSDSKSSSYRSRMMDIGPQLGEGQESLLCEPLIG